MTGITQTGVLHAAATGLEVPETFSNVTKPAPTSTVRPPTMIPIAVTFIEKNRNETLPNVDTEATFPVVSNQVLPASLGSKSIDTTVLTMRNASWCVGLVELSTSEINLKNKKYTKCI